MTRSIPPTSVHAESTFIVPCMATTMVRTGFRITVSTPAMEAMCTTRSWPSMASRTAAASQTSP